MLIQFKYHIYFELVLLNSSSYFLENFSCSTWGKVFTLLSMDFLGSAMAATTASAHLPVTESRCGGLSDDLWET